MPHRIHTIHHHHIQKYTVVKKIEVPVIKEVKVPYKVYVIQKVPYKYYVKPLVVKVPVEYYHIKSEEHQHDKHEGGHGGDGGGHGGDGGGHGGDGGGHGGYGGGDGGYGGGDGGHGSGGHGGGDGGHHDEIPQQQFHHHQHIYHDE